MHLIMPNKAPDELHDKARDLLARMSPKKLAGIVSLRDGNMMANIKLLWKTARGAARPFWKSLDTSIACPHCVFKNGSYRCCECLWTRAAMASGIDARLMACTSIKFGGLTLSDVTAGHRYVKAICFHDGAQASVSIPHSIFDPDAEETAAREYGECVRYLEAHMEWSDGNWGGGK